jgi:hypothetical protein
MLPFNPSKEVRQKEKNDKMLKVQLEKEREQMLITEIEKNEKERIKKKGLKTLKQSGILDSYQYLLTSLCKYGLPTGDLYEFSALTVLRYEKKLKAERKRELDTRIKERQEQKHKQMGGKFGPKKGVSKEKTKGDKKGADGPPVAPNYNELKLPRDAR